MDIVDYYIDFVDYNILEEDSVGRIHFEEVVDYNIAHFDYIDDYIVLEKVVVDYFVDMDFVLEED